MVRDATKESFVGVADLDPCTHAVSPISRWARAKQRFPIRTAMAAVTLFTLGSVLLYVSTRFGLDDEQRGLSFFILGLITFIPGSYATTQLYGAYKGWPGYDYSQVPSAALAQCMASDRSSLLPSLPPMNRGSSSSSSSSSHSSFSRGSLPTPRSCSAYDDDISMATGAPNGEFYTEVESFLNRPSPSLAKIAKSSKSTENLLPMLKAERSKLRVEKPDGRTATTATSAASKKTKKPLDLSLVHQAFAYANQLRQQENQDDDDDYEQDQPIEVEKKHHHAIGTEKPSKPSGKSKQNNGTMKTKTKSTASSIYGGSGNGGASQKTQSKPKAGPDWDSCSKDAPSSHQNTSMDPQLMQQLLSNFQNGTTLAELRQELAASQASLKESRQILQGAAKTFFMKGSIQC